MKIKEDVFKAPDAPELKQRKKGEKEARRREVELSRPSDVAAHTETSSGRKVCLVCRSTIPAGNKLISIAYSSRWGTQHKSICQDCIQIAATNMRGA